VEVQITWSRSRLSSVSAESVRPGKTSALNVQYLVLALLVFYTQEDPATGRRTRVDTDLLEPVLLNHETADFVPQLLRIDVDSGDDILRYEERDRAYRRQMERAIKAMGGVRQLEFAMLDLDCGSYSELVWRFPCKFLASGTLDFALYAHTFYTSSTRKTLPLLPSETFLRPPLVPSQTLASLPASHSRPPRPHRYRHQRLDGVDPLTQDSHSRSCQIRTPRLDS